MYCYSDFVRDPFLATRDLATLLREGCLSLFLGSGISAGFGLPEWAALVADLVGRRDNLPYIAELRTKSDKDLAKLIDPIDDSTLNFHRKVHEGLYRGVAPSLLDQLSRSPLLLAVAALVSGSCRGRISTVFTYNYDNLLEQYMEMLGQKVCIRKAPSDFSSWADLEVNHLHGYLPQDGTGIDGTTELVLSEKSYRDRRAGIDEGWSAAVQNSLQQRAGLFLGLSGDDSSITDILRRAQKAIRRPADYNGYWLMSPTAYSRNSDAIVQVGMCPIRIEISEFPRFVFEVCRRAR